MTSAVQATISLYPTSDQIRTLLAAPDDQPVVMLNLLRLRPKADSPEGDLSGEEAYRLYAEKMVPFVESKGGRVVWAGRVESQVIGGGAESFQMIALVEYPSRKAFVEIASDPYVAEIAAHRAAGLEGQWLVAATTSAP
jgi:uncharacterized protein (DUF1330 family)